MKNLNPSEKGVLRLFHYQPAGADGTEFVDALFIDRALHFSRVGSLNDPFDMRPPYDFLSLSKPEARRHMIEFFMRGYQQQGYDFHLAAYKVGKYLAAIEAAERDHPEFGDLTVAGKQRAITQYVGGFMSVYCCSTRSDDTSMWDRYARANTGVCIEFDALVWPFNMALQVQYSDQAHPVDLTDPTSAAVNQFLRKRSEWAPEREYRLIGRDINAPHPGKVSMKLVNERLTLSDLRSVCSIRLGHAMSEETQDSILRTVRAAAPHVLVKRVRLDYATGALVTEDLAK